MYRLLILLLLFALLWLSGCRSRSDLVEAELRTKDRQLRELQEEHARTKIINQALEREFLHRTTEGYSVPIREGGSSICPIKDIQLGAGTGGVDEDREPGDECLMVVLVPRDEDGHPFKAIGSLTVQAIEITPEGLKTPLCSWEVSAVQLRRNWQQGLFSNGYHIKLLWKRPPSTEKLRVEVQFTLTDGRVFGADRDVRVRLGYVPMNERPIQVPTQEPPINLPPTNLLPFPQSGPVLDNPTSLNRRAEMGTPRPASPE